MGLLKINLVPKIEIECSLNYLTCNVLSITFCHDVVSATWPISLWMKTGNPRWKHEWFWEIVCRLCVQCWGLFPWFHPGTARSFSHWPRCFNKPVWEMQILRKLRPSACISFDPCWPSECPRTFTFCQTLKSSEVGSKAGALIGTSYASERWHWSGKRRGTPPSVQAGQLLGAQCQLLWKQPWVLRSKGKT